MCSHEKVKPTRKTSSPGETASSSGAHAPPARRTPAANEPTAHLIAPARPQNPRDNSQPPHNLITATALDPTHPSPLVTPQPTRSRCRQSQAHAQHLPNHNKFLGRNRRAERGVPPAPAHRTHAEEAADPHPLTALQNDSSRTGCAGRPQQMYKQAG